MSDDKKKSGEGIKKQFEHMEESLRGGVVINTSEVPDEIPTFTSGGQSSNDAESGDSNS